MLKNQKTTKMKDIHSEEFKKNFNLLQNEIRNSIYTSNSNAVKSLSVLADGMNIINKEIKTRSKL